LHAQLSKTVLVKHVKEAVRLMQVATYAALVDPSTGRLDFEQLNAVCINAKHILFVFDYTPRSW
jgi:DNA replicative helicase MCM subunit Mcm2 (Cdc46/Mcm family)